MKSNVSVNIVKRKFEGWKSEQEFIELSTIIYIIDNGFRKKNEPFVKSNENRVLDDYDSSFDTDSKMRCYIITRLFVVGYGNVEKFENTEAITNPFEHFFGKSYRELVDYMREFNYDRRCEGICVLNFYEI